MISEFISSTVEFAIRKEFVSTGHEPVGDGGTTSSTAGEAIRLITCGWTQGGRGDAHPVSGTVSLWVGLDPAGSALVGEVSGHCCADELSEFYP